MLKIDIIKLLSLKPHPTEGGYFRRTYESDINFDNNNSQRKILTSIYYLLTNDSPIGYLHKNKSDIIHYHHIGSPIKYLIVSPNGIFNEKILGSDIASGQLPQLVVKGGDWKAAELCSGEFGLISEAVAPGFEYDDNEIATRKMIRILYPYLMSQLGDYIKS